MRVVYLLINICFCVCVCVCQCYVNVVKKKFCKHCLKKVSIKAQEYQYCDDCNPDVSFCLMSRFIPGVVNRIGRRVKKIISSSFLPPFIPLCRQYWVLSRVLQKFLVFPTDYPNTVFRNTESGVDTVTHALMDTQHTVTHTVDRHIRSDTYKHTVNTHIRAPITMHTVTHTQHTCNHSNAITTTHKTFWLKFTCNYFFQKDGFNYKTIK